MFTAQNSKVSDYHPVLSKSNTKSDFNKFWESFPGCPHWSWRRLEEGGLHMFLQLHRCFMCLLSWKDFCWGILHALLKRLLLRIWYVLLKISLLRYLMCSLKSIIAEVFENISMRYLMCSLDIIGLVSIIISSNCLFSSLGCGEILSWSSQQVVYRWLCKPAIFQELFHRWLRLLATFQPLFSSQILQNRFLFIKLFKSLILQRRLKEIEMV